MNEDNAINLDLTSTELRNAGFLVGRWKGSIIIFLGNRDVTVQEVREALNELIPDVQFGFKSFRHGLFGYFNSVKVSL